MPLILNTTPDEEAQFTAAAREEGLEPVDLFRRLLKQHLLQQTSPENPDPMLALFDQWEAEDQVMTPAEIQLEKQSWDVLKNAINTERDRAGARRVF